MLNLSRRNKPITDDNATVGWLSNEAIVRLILDEQQWVFVKNETDPTTRIEDSHSTSESTREFICFAFTLLEEKKRIKINLFTSDKSIPQFAHKKPVEPLLSSSWHAYAADPAHQATKFPIAPSDHRSFTAKEIYQT